MLRPYLGLILILNNIELPFVLGGTFEREPRMRSGWLVYAIWPVFENGRSEKTNINQKIHGEYTREAIGLSLFVSRPPLFYPLSVSSGTLRRPSRHRTLDGLF